MRRTDKVIFVSREEGDDEVGIGDLRHYRPGDDSTLVLVPMRDVPKLIKALRAEWRGRKAEKVAADEAAG